MLVTVDDSPYIRFVSYRQWNELFEHFRLSLAVSFLLTFAVYCQLPLILTFRLVIIGNYFILNIFVVTVTDWFLCKCLCVYIRLVLHIVLPSCQHDFFVHFRLVAGRLIFSVNVRMYTSDRFTILFRLYASVWLFY